MEIEHLNDMALVALEELSLLTHLSLRNIHIEFPSLQLRVWFMKIEILLGSKLWRPLGIAFTCHLDHPRPGANDNASGSTARRAL